MSDEGGHPPSQVEFGAGVQEGPYSALFRIPVPFSAFANRSINPCWIHVCDNVAGGAENKAQLQSTQSQKRKEDSQYRIPGD
jgi:hypothetical protein